ARTSGGRRRPRHRGALVCGQQPARPPRGTGAARAPAPRARAGADGRQPAARRPHPRPEPQHAPQALPRTVAAGHPRGAPTAGQRERVVEEPPGSRGTPSVGGLFRGAPRLRRGARRLGGMGGHFGAPHVYVYRPDSAANASIWSVSPNTRTTSPARSIVSGGGLSTSPSARRIATTVTPKRSRIRASRSERSVTPPAPSASSRTSGSATVAAAPASASARSIALRYRSRSR